MHIKILSHKRALSFLICMCTHRLTHTPKSPFAHRNGCICNNCRHVGSSGHSVPCKERCLWWSHTLDDSKKECIFVLYCKHQSNQLHNSMVSRSTIGAQHRQHSTSFNIKRKLFKQCWQGTELYMVRLMKADRDI